MPMLAAVVIPLLLAVAAGAQQSGRTIAQNGLPILGQTLQFSLRYPAAAVGNPFWFLFSLSPYPGIAPFLQPGYLVLGNLKLDPASVAAGALGVLSAGGLATQSLALPAAPNLLGIALEVQGLDLTPSPATVAFSDNDLEVVVQSVPQWESELVLSASHGTTTPLLRTNRTGAAVLAYREGNQVVARTFTPSGGWSGMTQLGIGNPLDLGIDSAGRAVVLYEAWLTGALAARRFVPGVGWTPEVRIDDGQGPWTGARLAVAPNGECIAVWQQFWWPNARSEVMGTRLVGAQWAVPLPVDSLNDGQAYAPAIAINDDGRALVIFQWAVQLPSGAFAISLRYGPYIYGPNLFQTFVTAPTQTSMDSLRLLVDTAGRAVCVWGSGGTVWFSRYTSQAWNSPQPLAAALADPGIGVAANSSGQGFLCWREVTAGGVAAMACPFHFDGSLGAPVVVNGPAANPAMTAVAVDEAGGAILVWSSTPQIGIPRTMWHNQFVAGSGWGTAAPLDANPNGLAGATIAMDRQGDAHVAWSRRVPFTSDYELIVRARR